MLSKINHVAIVSENYAQLAQFYEAAFAMKTSAKTRPGRAVTVGDGYVGLNINPRRAGRAAGLDHFGIQVEDCETVFERMRKKYPTVKWLKRPSNRPFAGLSSHDPAGNFFDLSHVSMANRTDAYTDTSLQGQELPARVHHFMLRAMDPAVLARFYADVYELQEQPKDAGDPRYYLSDGRITLVIAPWKISDWEGSTAELPAIDHIGFQIKSMDDFDATIRQITGRNRIISPRLLHGGGDEREARLQLFKRCCPYGEFHLADPDGNLLDVVEG